MKIHQTQENKLSKLVLFAGNRSVWLEETIDKWMQDCAKETRRSVSHHTGNN